MEHILQFGISIDDQKIIDTVMQKATKEIMDELKLAAKKEMFQLDRKYYSEEYVIIGFQKWVEDIFNKFLEDHKNAILKMATDKLVDRMYKSKAVKEAIADVVKGE